MRESGYTRQGMENRGILHSALIWRFALLDVDENVITTVGREASEEIDREIAYQKRNSSK